MRPQLLGNWIKVAILPIRQDVSYQKVALLHQLPVSHLPLSH
jgi:hypothetical protein